MERDLQKGIIKPLKTTSFNACDIEQAFRFLASGKHMGKVVLKLRENETDDEDDDEDEDKKDNFKKDMDLLFDLFKEKTRRINESLKILKALNAINIQSDKK